MDRYQIISIIHDYMSRYDKKNKNDSQNVSAAALLFAFDICLLNQSFFLTKCLYLISKDFL